MRVLATASVLALMTLVGAGQAQAAGCIKGAIVGGIAGHVLGNRAGLGAAAGCAGGYYLNKRRARARDVDYGRGGYGRGYDRGYDRRGYGY